VKRSKKMAIVLLVAFAVLSLNLPVFGACYKLVSYLCHLGTGPFTCQKGCQVNCLCPHDAVINGTCRKTYTGTCVDSDSSSHSLACSNANTTGTDKCIPFTIEDGCAWTSQELVCPSILPFPLVCVTTIAPVTKYGPRQGVVTGRPCAAG
jgi:hypothetical protein